MTHARFVQLHLLVSYAPSNLNRDDMGRPKSALMGGKGRLRVSSQALKRAWRTSEVFEALVGEHVGTRTRQLGREVYQVLTAEGGMTKKDALAAAKAVAGVFGKNKSPKTKDKGKDKGKGKGKGKGDGEEQLSMDQVHGAQAAQDDGLQELEIEQLVHVSPEERRAVMELAATLFKEKRQPTTQELKLLRARAKAVDIAMFGRMLAASPEYNVEAAVQVAHAITTHEASAQEDYFSAVDDLNHLSPDAGAGAAHIGESEFGAGVFYLYACVDVSQLVENLDGDRELAARALEALLSTSAQVSPTGKQNSYASRARASYVMVERGDAQPRSLAAAFLSEPDSRRHGDQLRASIEALEQTRSRFEAAYGQETTAKALNVYQEQPTTLQDLVSFAQEALHVAG